MTNNNKWLHTCLKRISTLTTLNGGKRRLLENAYYVCALAKSSGAYAWKTQTWRNSMHDEFRCTDDTLQHEFELSTHPSIPPNSHVGSIRWLFFYYISPKRLSCFFYSRINRNSRMIAWRFYHRQICFPQTTDFTHA